MHIILFTRLSPRYVMVTCLTHGDGVGGRGRWGVGRRAWGLRWGEETGGLKIEECVKKDRYFEKRTRRRASRVPFRPILCVRASMYAWLRRKRKAVDRPTDRSIDRTQARHSRKFTLWLKPSHVVKIKLNNEHVYLEVLNHGTFQQLRIFA